MKTTLCRDATDGEVSVYYKIDSDGGDVEIVAVQLGLVELDFWKLPEADRHRFQRIAEDDADRHEAEMRGGEEP